MPGMGHGKTWWRQYEGLRAHGKSKASSARITNWAQSRKKKKRKRRRR